MSAQAVTIRSERSEDFPIVHELVREAFEGAEHTDGDDKGQIVGHIMFTRLKVGECLMEPRC